MSHLHTENVETKFGQRNIDFMQFCVAAPSQRGSSSIKHQLYFWVRTFALFCVLSNFGLHVHRSLRGHVRKICQIKHAFVSCCVNEGAASYIFTACFTSTAACGDVISHQPKPAQVVLLMFQLSLLSPLGGPVTQSNILLQQLPPKVTPTVTSTCGPFPWE